MTVGESPQEQEPLEPELHEAAELPWSEDDPAEPRRRRRADAEDPNALEEIRAARERQRALMVGVLSMGDDLAELRELLSTAQVQVVGEMVQHRDEHHPNTYVGPGKVGEIKQLAKELGANVVVTDDELSPRQERNLEQELGLPVIDRTALILDIFAGHAHSAEGKLQVELAQLQYNLARMRGLWTHLDRLGVGGVGTRGPGETQIETDRRLARGRISQLRKRLSAVTDHRATMRAERERAQLPTLALAGYTNAGKSTLLGALSGAEVSTGDMLFHTLDPATRTARLAGRQYLITDTVGFIRKLPHQLVDAFGATLTETRLADLILHVVDASEDDDQRAVTIQTVEDVLGDIGAGERPRLLVLNKIDRLEQADRDALRFRHPEAVQVSAATGEGLELLIDVIERAFAERAQELALVIPYSEGRLITDLYRLDAELQREDAADGVHITARIPHERVAHFSRFLAEGAAS